MKRIAGVLLAVPAVAIAVLILLGTVRAAPPDKAAAPGAAVIDASKYPSLQAALDAVPAGGGLVRLPPGRFELPRPLVLTRAETRIEGSGAATHLVNRNEAGEPALILRPADRATKRGARIWRVQVADFRISGNPKSGDGLRAEGINEIYIHGLSVDHNGGHGVNLVDCYEDPRVCDSILTYNQHAGLNILRGHDIVVNGNQFEENEDAVRCIDSFNLCMNGNNLDDHLRHGVVIENTYGSVLSGNMIEECNGTAVVMDRDCYGNTVSANVLAHNGGGGVDLRDAWGCAVSANTFTMSKALGVRVGPGSGRITISANNFSNAHIGGKTKRDDPAAGVVLDGAADVAVGGNVFTGLQGPAVDVRGECRHVAVTGNVMGELHLAARAAGKTPQPPAQPADSLFANNLPPDN